jgi:hypothetical protein
MGGVGLQANPARREGLCRGAFLGDDFDVTGEANAGTGSKEAAWTALKGALPTPASPGHETKLVEQQFTAQFRWYDRQATRTRLAYQVLRVAALAIGAVVTVLAASSAPAALTASLAATVVILEGVQQLFQLQKNWISYRSSAEGMRRHWFFYSARLFPYDVDATRTGLLANAMQDVAATENSGWGTTMLSPSTAAPGTTSAP